MRLAFLFLALSSVAMVRSEPAIRARAPAMTRVVATPIPLDTAGGRTRIGALRYVRGWALTSADPRFGGVSAMSREAGGFVMLSDAGTVMRLRFAGGKPDHVRLTPLAAGPGDSNRKADRDSEALVLHAGRAWVAYERHNMVWRYTADFARAEGSRAPPEMRRWRANSGAEAMVRLPDGRFLVFSESRGNAAGSSDVLLFGFDPTDARAKSVRMAYRLPKGFSVTDAASLGDGRIVTLHRSFSLTGGVAASLGVFDQSEARSGAVIEPRLLATLRPPLNVDNMEAIAVERPEVGRSGPRTRIWIASDDNFSGLQRTLLMQFDLAE